MPSALDDFLAMMKRQYYTDHALRKRVHKHFGRQTATVTATTGKCSRRCPDDKVCNPHTGNCVLKAGAVGRRIMGGASAEKIAAKIANARKVSVTVPVQGICPPDRRYNIRTGKCDKIPAGGRKAPPEHAHTFRGHTMTGIDGGLWISAPKSSGSETYVWKRVT